MDRYRIRHPARRLVSRVVVEPGAPHDTVRVWSRGGLAGVLTVPSGDGERIAARLRSTEPHLHVEPARETHLAASVSITRRPGGPLGEAREAAWVEVVGIGFAEGGSESYADLRVGSIVWLEDGRGVRGPDYTVRAWPYRPWSSDGSPRIEVVSEEEAPEEAPDAE